MADQKGKDMLKEEELNQVAGGGWLESGMDERFAKEYEKYGIKVLSKSIFGENTEFLAKHSDGKFPFFIGLFNYGKVLLLSHW